MSNEKEKRETKKVMAVLSALRSFDNILRAKGKNFDYSKIRSIYLLLENEVKKQTFELIKKSKEPEKARKAKDILADLAKGERLTPELLREIKRLQKRKEKEDEPEKKEPKKKKTKKKS